MWGSEGEEGAQSVCPSLCFAYGAGSRGGKLRSAFFHSFSQFPAISRNFSAIAFCLPTLRALGSPMYAELLLFEASGGLVTAPQFSHNYPTIFRNFPHFFAIGLDAP